MEVNVGDYVVGCHVYKIVRIYSTGLNKRFDLVCLSKAPECSTTWNSVKKEFEDISKLIKLPKLPLNYVRHLGKLIKSKEASHIKVLFDNK